MCFIKKKKINNNLFKSNKQLIINQKKKKTINYNLSSKISVIKIMIIYILLELILK